MTSRLPAILLSLLAPLASAESPSAERAAASPVARPSSVPAHGADLKTRPDIALIREAFDASGLAEANAVLVVDHDAEGVPTALRLEPGSGHEALDQAMLGWGRGLRYAPGAAGTARLPLRFSAPLPAPEIAFERILKHPPMRILQQAVVRHGRSASFEVLIDYDAEGRVTAARLMRSSGDQAFDRTVLAWINAIRLRPGAAGTGRLPMSFHTE